MLVVSLTGVPVVANGKSTNSTRDDSTKRDKDAKVDGRQSGFGGGDRRVKANEEGGKAILASKLGQTETSVADKVPTEKGTHLAAAIERSLLQYYSHWHDGYESIDVFRAIVADRHNVALATVDTIWNIMKQSNRFQHVLPALHEAKCRFQPSQGEEDCFNAVLLTSYSPSAWMMASDHPILPTTEAAIVSPTQSDPADGPCVHSGAEVVLIPEATMANSSSDLLKRQGENASLELPPSKKRNAAESRPPSPPTARVGDMTALVQSTQVSAIKPLLQQHPPDQQQQPSICEFRSLAPKSKESATSFELCPVAAVSVVAPNPELVDRSLEPLTPSPKLGRCCSADTDDVCELVMDIDEYEIFVQDPYVYLGINDKDIELDIKVIDERSSS